MFEGKSIICSEGHPAHFICTYTECSATLFVCSKTCPCFSTHSTSCKLKNIKELSNGIESLLKRNFRKDLKGDSIEVVARVARQMVSIPVNKPFAFSYCDVNPKVDIQFQIKTLKGCIGVGALNRNKVVENHYNFLPNPDYIKHGAYMILTNGYQYSHSELEENFVEYRGIVLEEGSRVRIFSTDSEIVFEQGFKQVRMKVPEEEMQQLTYGVYLYNEGDAIEVLVKQ